MEGASLVLEVEKRVRATFEKTLQDTLSASEQRLAQATKVARAKDLDAAEAIRAAMQSEAKAVRAEIECTIIRNELRHEGDEVDAARETPHRTVKTRLR